MKKIIVGLLLLVSMKSYGQLIVNGDFSINAGDCVCLPGCLAATTFTDGTVLNWWRTHGTPEVARAPHSMFMFSADGLGEGIVGGYNFKQGNTYIIDTKISGSPASSIHLEARKGARPLNNNCAEMFCTVAGQTGSMGYQGIAPTSSSFQNIISSPLNFGENIFLYTPNDDYTWIMMYPSLDDNCNEANIYTDHIYVSLQCKEEKYIDQFDNSINPLNIVEPYYTYGYKRIYVGSKYGSSSLADNHGRNGEWTAKDFILFSENTLITPTPASHNVTAKFFTASIDPYYCNSIPSHDGGGGAAGRAEAPAYDPLTGYKNSSLKNKYVINSGNNNLAGKTTDVKNVTQTEGILHVYPNPSSGILTIEFPSEDDYNLVLTNYTGTTVYKHTVSNTQKHVIDMDSKLPNGNYFLRIEGKNLKHVQKISLYR